MPMVFLEDPKCKVAIASTESGEVLGISGAFFPGSFSLAQAVTQPRRIAAISLAQRRLLTKKISMILDYHVQLTKFTRTYQNHP